MDEVTGTAGRYTVEGFQSGIWHPILSVEDRETAIRGTASIAVSGAFDFVRMTRRTDGAGPRELVRVDRKGTVWNGAFVKPLGPGLPAIVKPTLPAIVEPVSARSTEPRMPFVAAAMALTVFGAGIAIGRWAALVI